MLNAIVLFAAPILALEIDAPRAVPKGEPFHVVARLVNRSSQPLNIVRPDVVARPLGVTFGGGLFQGTRLVTTTIGGLRSTQTAEPWSYGPWAFQTLKPGESIIVEDIVYRKVYANGKTPSLKSELGSAPTQDLPAGDYRLRFDYAFHPEFHLNVHGWGKDAPARRLTPEGRKLYKSAWKGRVEAAVSLTVSGA